MRGLSFFTLIPLIQPPLKYTPPTPIPHHDLVLFDSSDSIPRIQVDDLDHTTFEMPGAKKGKRVMAAEAEEAISSPPAKKTKSSKPGKSKHVFIPSRPCPLVIMV
jgi:hypothetical protein